MLDNIIILSIIAVYLIIVISLSLRGYVKTKTQEDFLVAGRQTHPFVMAMSYGAAFISTSAIVGFGGMAGCYGMNMMWLPFMNVFFGIIIAFIYFGKRTRKIGQNLGAKTFPEFMGMRYDSKWMKVFTSGIMFFFMPLYCAVVLIGGARFMEKLLQINYNVAVFGFAIVIVIYVLIGGLKGVMYVDAIMGLIMIAGMTTLLVLTYCELGGFFSAHQKLTELVPLVPKAMAAKGSLGWTEAPMFNSEVWWLVVTSLMLGVGLGVLAQPQLAVRFMTVKSGRELNRAILIGSIFIITTAGSAYMCGALSNIWFYEKYGMVSIDFVQDEEYTNKAIQAKIAGEEMPVREPNPNLKPGNPDQIIPVFLNLALPRWMMYFFAMTLLSAAMTTLSALLHSMGSAIGHDFFGTIFGQKHDSFFLTKAGIVVGLIASVILAYVLPEGIVAKGTALFFGICAAAFLPAYFGALYWPRVTRKAVWWSMVGGFCASMFWMLFMHRSESKAIGLCNWLFGKTELISTHPMPFVDPMVVALPVSAILLIIITLCTKKLPRKHIAKCFKDIKVREF